MTQFKGHHLSAEQLYALDEYKALKSGELLVLDAGAGASKTYTSNALVSLCDSNAKVLVLAFNRVIVDEMKGAFPEGTTVVTTHELARKHIKKYSEDRLKQPLLPKNIIDALELPEWVNEKPSQEFATSLIQTLVAYCTSDSLTIESYIRSQNQSQYGSMLQVRTLEYYLKRLWDKLTDPSSSLPVIHDVYLKEFVVMVVNGVLKLPYDVVILDEGQDSAPVVRQLFMALTCDKRVVAGDRFQSIYEWRSAVNVMQELVAQGHKTARLTTCYRFGQELADLTNELLKEHYGYSPQFKGNPEKKTKIIEGHSGNAAPTPGLWLFRTNAELLATLLEHYEAGAKCRLMKDTTEYLRLINDAERLFSGARVRKGLLRAFAHWSEFQEYANSELGGALRSFNNAINTYGFDKMREVINSASLVSESEATHIYSTAHSCKGIEMNTVIINDDFDYAINRATGRELLQEVHLLYVAITRAIKTLDVSRCKTLLSTLRQCNTKLNTEAMTAKKQLLEELGL